MNSLGLKKNRICTLLSFAIYFNHFAIVCIYFLVLRRLFFGAPRLTHE